MTKCIKVCMRLFYELCFEWNIIGFKLIPSSSRSQKTKFEGIPYFGNLWSSQIVMVESSPTHQINTYTFSKAHLFSQMKLIQSWELLRKLYIVLYSSWDWWRWGGDLYTDDYGWWVRFGSKLFVSGGYQTVVG